MAKPKSTSYEYGHDYQTRLLAKYKHRNENHWRVRIELANSLVEDYALPRLKTRSRQEIVVVDVGCSIGTFAIEFAKRGYRSYGIDFDASAIGLATQLAADEGVAPEFVCGDISDWGGEFPLIDIAVCFDIFEHLHDDELGAFLSSIRRQLSADGAVVFHTFPTAYDHLFHWRAYRSWPLVPLAGAPPSIFGRAVCAYSSFFDASLALITGQTYRERIMYRPHCNPTTLDRLTDILNRMDYDVLSIEAANLYGEDSFAARWFRHQPVTFRNLYGVAVPKQHGID
jgi:2-polyprenyl-3-methyl-5-hydroxy-6-metoxy-1,4-benzoquinol methylase